MKSQPPLTQEQIKEIISEMTKQKDGLQNILKIALGSVKLFTDFR